MPHPKPGGSDLELTVLPGVAEVQRGLLVVKVLEVVARGPRLTRPYTTSVAADPDNPASGVAR
jgi:hypothetical protein